MEWDDLKHFLAVARTGSLTDAARDLKTSAATVGRRIAELEQRLDAQLFHRRSSGYTLTESGEAIRSRAEDVEQAVLAVEREAVGRHAEVTGTVRIATTEDIAAMVIVPNLAEFARTHPGIAIEIIGRYDLANLTRRDADIALRTVRPDRGDLLVRKVGAVDLAVYAAKSYVAARGLVQGQMDFSNVEIITWVEEMANLRGGPWLAEHAHGARVALRVNSSRLINEACRAGLGVAILPCFAADADPEFVCLVPPEKVISIDCWSVVHHDLSRTARVRAVLDFLASLGPKLGRQRPPEPAPVPTQKHARLTRVR